MKQASTLVDLCAGNGAVSLFMAPRVKGKIAMVEIQPRLADMARRSVALNQLDQQITVYQQDLATIFDQIHKDSIDAVSAIRRILPICRIVRKIRISTWLLPVMKLPRPWKPLFQSLAGY